MITLFRRASILNSVSSFQTTIIMHKTEKSSGRKLKRVSEITISKTVEVKTFRAKITASKTHYLQQVIGHRTSLIDAHNDRFRSDMYVFIPKLTPQYQRPHVMLSAKNGGGSILMRAKDPIQLALLFEELAQTLRSNAFLDAWQEITNISEKLVCGTDPVTMDDQFLDVKEFEHSFIEHGREMCNYAKVK